MEKEIEDIIESADSLIKNSSKADSHGNCGVWDSDLKRLEVALKDYFAAKRKAQARAARKAVKS